MWEIFFDFTIPIVKWIFICFLFITPNAVCKVAKDPSGKPKVFLNDEVSKLQIDNEMKEKIRKWIDENDSPF